MTTTASRISPVHGGLEAPVNRIDAAAASDASLFRLDVNETDRTSLYRIADGTLSPLTGPMGESDYRSVLERRSIERDGSLWAWTIPVMLPVTDFEAEGCEVGSKVGLYHAGEMFGTLTVSSVYAWDKNAFIKAVYGTERTDHPGAGLWTSDERTRLVGGEISLVPFVDQRPFAERVLSPKQTRALIETKGWEQSVAFQTRNPLHRAHEYALVYGAETILRDNGRKTGVVLNPLVGQLKGDDVPASVRMDTYEALVGNRLLGEGDADVELWSEHGQNLNDQLELIGLDMRMYYGGPCEAVMHAIYRQNLGFTHFIIGRKHADAPFNDGEAIWGDFDAQEIFDNLEGQLAIDTVNVGFAAFFEEIDRVGLISDNKDNTSVFISGTKVRAQLCAGDNPDPRIMRETTAKILVDYYKAKASQG
ncbi:MAG: sulfate adenylyltransferase [Planctomycetes bacterium]|nr:sulfate adenylyltransferase [Planctomycetota bacterium]